MDELGQAEVGVKEKLKLLYNAWFKRKMLFHLGKSSLSKIYP